VKVDDRGVGEKDFYDKKYVKNAYHPSVREWLVFLSHFEIFSERGISHLGWVHRLATDLNLGYHNPVREQELLTWLNKPDNWGVAVSEMYRRFIEEEERAAKASRGKSLAEAGADLRTGGEPDTPKEQPEEDPILKRKRFADSLPADDDEEEFIL
jgi:hypothetical protein